MMVLQNEVLGIMFSRVVPIPHHTVLLGKTYKPYSYASPDYYCDRKNRFEYVSYDKEVYIGSSLVPNQLEDECRIYSYYLQFLAKGINF